MQKHVELFLPSKTLSDQTIKLTERYQKVVEEIVYRYLFNKSDVKKSLIFTL